jgi:hypothetical protein
MSATKIGAAQITYVEYDECFMPALLLRRWWSLLQFQLKA